MRHQHSLVRLVRTPWTDQLAPSDSDDNRVFKKVVVYMVHSDQRSGRRHNPDPTRTPCTFPTLDYQARIERNMIG